MNKAVIYATGLTKHTKAAGDYIAKQLGADRFDLGQITKINITEYRTIVFGTGIHAGKPYKSLVNFLQANQEALEGKNLYLFIECMYSGEKGEAQCQKVSEQLGIANAAFFNTKAEEMNEAGFPASLDEFISGINRCSGFSTRQSTSSSSPCTLRTSSKRKRVSGG